MFFDVDSRADEWLIPFAGNMDWLALMGGVPLLPAIPTSSTESPLDGASTEGSGVPSGTGASLDTGHPSDTGLAADLGTPSGTPATEVHSGADGSPGIVVPVGSEAAETRLDTGGVLATCVSPGTGVSPGTCASPGTGVSSGSGTSFNTDTASIMDILPGAVSGATYLQGHGKTSHDSEVCATILLDSIGSSTAFTS